MSHIVTIQTEIRDVEALTRGCDRLGLDRPEHRMVQLFSSEATGYCVELPDWRYPVVCDVDAGRSRMTTSTGGGASRGISTLYSRLTRSSGRGWKLGGAGTRSRSRH